MPDRRVSLYIDNGFSYDASPSANLCANNQSIYVVNTGTPCLLGEFVKADKVPGGR